MERPRLDVVEDDPGRSYTFPVETPDFRMRVQVGEPEAMEIVNTYQISPDTVNGTPFVNQRLHPLDPRDSMSVSEIESWLASSEIDVALGIPPPAYMGLGLEPDLVDGEVPIASIDDLDDILSFLDRERPVVNVQMEQRQELRAANTVYDVDAEETAGMSMNMECEVTPQETEALQDVMPMEVDAIEETGTVPGITPLDHKEIEEFFVKAGLRTDEHEDVDCNDTKSEKQEEEEDDVGTFVRADTKNDYTRKDKKKVRSRKEKKRRRKQKRREQKRRNRRVKDGTSTEGVLATAEADDDVGVKDVASTSSMSMDVNADKRAKGRAKNQPRKRPREAEEDDAASMSMAAETEEPSRRKQRRERRARGVAKE